MYAIVVGGGKVGFFLTQTLINRGFEVTVIENNPNKCLKLEDEFGGQVLRGDGSSPQILERAGCSRADIVMAVTGRDEDNFIVCQMAKEHFGVGRTIARLNNPKNARVFREFQVGYAISSTTVIAGLIESEVATEHIAELLKFPSGEMLVIEVDLPQTTTLTGRLIRDLELPAGSLLVSIVREGGIILPRGDVAVAGGDRLIALTVPGDESKLKEILSR